MKSVNLIPLQRRAQSRKRRRARTWIAAGTGYAGLLGVVYLICASAWAGDDQTVAARLAKLPKEIDDATRMITRLQAQFDETQSKLDATRAVADQPDWAILLGLLGENVGDEIVINELRLDPLQPIEGGRAAPPSRAPGQVSGADSSVTTARSVLPQGYILNVAGMGRSQSAVSQFVLRMEQAGIFDRVSLLKTNRDTFGAGEAIAFRAEAIISADKKGTK